MNKSVDNYEMYLLYLYKLKNPIKHAMIEQIEI
jgi:hypothetical protein